VSAAEALFDGAPLAHVVAYRERQRLALIRRRNEEAARAFLRRHPGWALALTIGRT
jgi:hypothetical protein